MINLIPNEERKKMIRDFNLRLLVLFFVVLGCSVLIASVALLPSYFISKVRVELSQEKLNIEKNKPVLAVEQKTVEVITGLNKKLGMIERFQKGKYLISTQAINQIISRKMSDIKLTEITYEDNTQKGKKIGINGVAPSRERLMLFRKALEDDPSFSKVDLPISNFIKGSNIQFYLTLIPA